MRLIFCPTILFRWIFNATISVNNDLGLYNFFKITPVGSPTGPQQTPFSTKWLILVHVIMILVVLAEYLHE